MERGEREAVIAIIFTGDLMVMTDSDDAGATASDGGGGGIVDSAGIGASLH